jgi:hypothetical protein
MRLKKEQMSRTGTGSVYITYKGNKRPSMGTAFANYSAGAAVLILLIYIVNVCA